MEGNNRTNQGKTLDIKDKLGKTYDFRALFSYAQTAILVRLILVKKISLSFIARSHGD